MEINVSNYQYTLAFDNMDNFHIKMIKVIPQTGEISLILPYMGRKQILIQLTFINWSTDLVASEFPLKSVFGLPEIPKILENNITTNLQNNITATCSLENNITAGLENNITAGGGTLVRSLPNLLKVMDPKLDLR